MRHPLLVSLSLAFSAVLAIVLWFAISAGDAPAPTLDQDAPTAAGASATTATAEQATADSAAGTGGSDRTSIAPARRGQPAATGAALVGQVVDDKGLPVADAEVACLSGFGDMFPGMQGGGREFDLADLEDFDPEQMLQRAREVAEQRLVVTTDATGRFRLVPPGDGRMVALRVAARGHTTLDRTAQRPTTEDVDLGLLAVKRGAIVSGRVVDKQGKALVGARVTRRGGGGGGPGGGPGIRGIGGDGPELRFGADMPEFDFDFPGMDLFERMRDGDDGLTDEQGRFELAHVPPGDFSLRARHVDHPPARLDGLTVAVGGDLTGLVIVAEPGATISGRIVGAPSGLKGLRVQASVRRQDRGQQQPEFMAMFGGAADMMGDLGIPFGEKSADVDSEGRFVLRGLPVGQNYRLWGAQMGRGFAGNAICTDRVEAASGTAGVELRYDPGITVTFQVVDPRTGKGIERLWVRDQLRGAGGMEDMMNFMPRGGRARVYPDGKVTLANLRPKPKQSLSLGIDALGYAHLDKKDIALPQSGSLDLGPLRLQPTPLVHVTVRAADTGQPVAGATVRLEAERAGGGNPFERLAQGGQGVDFMAMGAEAMQRFGMGGGGPSSGRTDAEGYCALNATPGAKATVVVSSREYAPYTSTTLTLPTEDLRHAVTLLVGGRVDVQVVDADGKPIEGIRVEHAAPAGDRNGQQTDKTGVATFLRLAPGEHRFRLGGRSGGGGPGGMDIAAMAERFGMGGTGQTGGGWQSLVVEDGGQHALKLSKAATASLSGFVRENGTPLAGARIAFAEGQADANAGDDPQQMMQEAMARFGGGGGGRGRNARASDTGAYELKELPPGQHRLRITHKDRVMTTTVAVSLRPGENLFDIDLDAAIVRGVVRDPQGNPVEGATVSARVATAAPAAGGNRGNINAQFGGLLDGAMGGDMEIPGMSRSGVKTAADGSYELRGVQPGTALQLRATARGFAAASVDGIEVGRGQTRSGVDLKLSAAGKIKVTAQGTSPFSGVRATWAPLDGDATGVAPAVQMLRNGSGTLDGLRPGRWRVELMTGMQSTQEPRFVEVIAGETVTVAF